MSLLLEALKKAELAKRGAKAVDEPAAAALRVEPSVSDLPLELEAPTQPVITRQELPDISQPLEILSEDLPSARKQRARETGTSEAAAPARASVREPGMPSSSTHLESAVSEPATGVSAAESRTSEEQDALAQNAARQLFETTEVEYNPRRSFYITVAVLLLAGAGYGAYVWWQLQPRYAVVTTAALNDASKGGARTPAGGPAALPAAPVPAPQDTPAPGPPAASAPRTVAPSRAAGQPDTPVAAAQAAPAAPKGPVFTPSTASSARVGSAARPAADTPGGRRSTGSTSPPITVSPPALVVDPVIERAYEDYQRGDTASARDAYQSVLRREPGHRDALLGMAAIDMRMRNFDLAEARYLKLLEADPRDFDALAGLMSLRGQIDPIQSESRLKSLLASNPEANHLHFVLGNQYALQNRWPEAQDAYFKAYRTDPDNPDFAFNLAVSLDQLHQERLALQYYLRALALVAHRSGSFDQSQARVRIQELQRR